jgi:hypothetical protein
VFFEAGDAQIQQQRPFALFGLRRNALRQHSFERLGWPGRQFLARSHEIRLYCADGIFPGLLRDWFIRGRCLCQDRDGRQAQQRKQCPDYAAAVSVPQLNGRPR